MHVRVVSASNRTDQLLQALASVPNIVNLVVLRDAAVEPAGDVLMIDLPNESANEVIDLLRARGVDRSGSITIDRAGPVISTAASSAEAAAPGSSSEAVVWAEVEARARADSELTVSFVVLLVLATMIAAVGILTDSVVLIIGAMVIGPEYGPLVALAFAIFRRRREAAVRAGRTLVAGFAVAIPITFVFALIVRLVGATPTLYADGVLPLTSFISRPDGWSVVVATLAALAGTLSLIQVRSSALVGVFISVTTIPAAANVAVAAAHGRGGEAGGALAQLGLNVFVIVVVGAITFAIEYSIGQRLRRRRRALPRSGRTTAPRSNATRWRSSVRIGSFGAAVGRIHRSSTMTALKSTVDMYDLRMSEAARPLYDAVVGFIAEEVEPHTEQFFRLGEGRAERWGYGDGQLDLLDSIKSKAKQQGLWNFFLPDADTGEGLSNLDYAYIAIELGKNPIASECLNCSAPDTGNMEVLERVGTPEQKERWLKPLLNGEIRSAYAMTEPDIPSSDAKNIACRAVRDGNEWLINGEKYYISGAGDPRCKIMIVMVQTDPDGPPHKRQSQILVPMDTPGVEIVGAMHVFGEDDAPHGHMHLRFTDVRVPESNILLGEGRGFEISQVRLGPGRIHHCMRSVGAAERALELMVMRGLTREAFGKRISNLGKNVELVAKARIEIESMRRMVLTAAKAMDELGNAEARLWVSAVKAMVPIRVCEIVDEAIQVHGATGVSQWTPLARMYAWQRTLRLADGPDEVHWHVVGRAELASLEAAAESYDPKTEYYAGLAADANGDRGPGFSGP
jgi:acyl-CoA dehydrogenase